MVGIGIAVIVGVGLLALWRASLGSFDVLGPMVVVVEIVSWAVLLLASAVAIARRRWGAAFGRSVLGAAFARALRSEGGTGPS